jgi:chromosome segregation ATPase
MTSVDFSSASVEAERIAIQERIRGFKADQAEAREVLTALEERRASLRFDGEVRAQDVSDALSELEDEMTELRGDIREREELIRQAEDYLEHIERPLLESRLAELRVQIEEHAGGHPDLHRAALQAVRDAVVAIGEWATWHREGTTLRRQYDRTADRLAEEQWRGSPGPAVLFVSHERALIERTLSHPRAHVSAMPNAKDVETALKAIDRRIEQSEERY